MRDTIFALSSGALPSGVAVIRVSGPHSRFVCETLSGSVPAPRTTVLRDVVAADGSILDRGFVIWLPGPRSFTGEDCVELHLHGGKAVVAAVLKALGEIPGLRQAEAGEFTRRAFLNGKLDLVQAEALSDLILAETEAQRRFAHDNAAGAVSALYAEWRSRLLHARAMIEAELDFADEGDVPGSVAERVWSDVALLAEEIAAHCAGYHQAEIVRDGLNVVILGAPNAGKSSLINLLAKRDVAIVSDIPGTTRDLIEVALDLGGYKVRVADTAGLREAGDVVEREGVSRALARAQSADLILHLFGPDDAVDGSQPVDGDGRVLRVASKSDLGGTAADVDLRISVLDGTGIDTLLTLLAEEAQHALLHHLPMLSGAVVHVDPCLHAGGDPHAVTAHHFPAAS